MMLCALLALISIHSCKTRQRTQHKFLDPSAINTAIKPGDNFFQFADGKWFDSVKILSSASGTGSYYDLEITTGKRLQGILDSLSKSINTPNSIQQKIGDLYTAAMDTATIEKLGLEPVKPYLQQVYAIKNTEDIMQFIAAQHVLRTNILFEQGFGADDKNSAFNIAAYWQGGLGLPDRDYYFKTDTATLAIVKAYQLYITTLFTLSGDEKAVATTKMRQVYNLEKQLAASHNTNVELRDPQKNYHKLLVTELGKQMPLFAWKNMLAATGVHADSVLVQKPAFFMQINDLLKSAPITTWQAYLQAHTLSSYASRLSNKYVAAAFAYNKMLTGQQQLKPRAERMVAVVDLALGEALGQLYVQKYFSEEAKKSMLVLVNNLQIAFEARIKNLQWMSDSTKAKATKKLTAFIKKIGFPDKWRDYSKVNIDKHTYFEDVIAASKNEYQFQLAKVGTAVDKTAWAMTPPTINAYYNSTFNEIVFPAGILQFPFFDVAADDAINYGAIGVVIGHEMTHGFDDHGAQYDENGNLKNWWSKEDATQFKAKTSAVASLYNSFTVLDSVHINGDLTNGENIADMGGLAIAYDAFKLTSQGKDTIRIDGFTPDQRFFLSFAQMYKVKQKDDMVRMLINTDPHSPELWRVNGPLVNFVPFYKAFNVKPTDKMYTDDAKRINIW